MIKKIISKLLRRSGKPESIEIPSVEYQFSQSDFHSGYFNGRNKIPCQQRIKHWPKVELDNEQ